MPRLRMSHLRIPLSLSVLCLAAAAPLSAHPGHGSTDSASAAHYLIETPHALWLLPVLAFAALASARFVGQRARAAARRRHP